MGESAFGGQSRSSKDASYEWSLSKTERPCIMPFQTVTLRSEEETMKLHYYPETDSLYIDLASRPSADSREITDGLVIDFDAEGNIVGIDIDNASKKLDLSKLETEALPITP